MAETKEELGKLRVVDLKKRLVEHGLPNRGLKAELVRRLHDFLTQSEGNDSCAD